MTSDIRQLTQALRPHLCLLPYAFLTCNLSLVPYTLRNQLHPIAIQLQKDEQQHCEAP